MASYTDDFAGTLAAWNADSGTWTPTSGTLRQTSPTGVYRKLRYLSAMDSNNYYSEAALRSSNGSNGAGVFVRGIVSAVVTMYLYLVFGDDASYMVELTAGAETILATGGAYTASTLITARCTANGTALTGTRGGTADISTTDGTLTTGAVGIGSYGAIDGANDNWDNWAGADLVQPVFPLPDVVNDLRRNAVYRM